MSSVLAYSLVTLGMAATAYAAVATFPLWVPFVVKKRRRSYDLPRRKYDIDNFDPEITSDELSLSSYLYGDDQRQHRRSRRRVNRYP